MVMALGHPWCWMASPGRLSETRSSWRSPSPAWLSWLRTFPVHGALPLHGTCCLN